MILALIPKVTGESIDVSNNLMDNSPVVRLRLTSVSPLSQPLNQLRLHQLYQNLFHKKMMELL